MTPLTSQRRGVREGAEMKHQFDICYCGDYRKDHAPGGGPCRFNKSHIHDLTHGYQDCDKFILATSFEQSGLNKQEGTRRVEP